MENVSEQESGMVVEGRSVSIKGQHCGNKIILCLDCSGNYMDLHMIKLLETTPFMTLVP